EFDNSLGSTFEVRSQIASGTSTERIGAMMLLRDGQRELSISFFENAIKVFDSGKDISTIASAPQPDHASVYRLAIVSNCGYVFIDKALAFTGVLKGMATRKGVQFGDFITDGRRSLFGIVDR